MMAPDTRAGFVAIVGAPNAGKSTLLNRLVGAKIAITTPKAQTTRNAIRGICMANDTAQVIFVDTPGIFEAKHQFEKAMVGAAWSGVADADLVMLVADATRGVCTEALKIAEKLKSQSAKAVLVLNKVDLVKKSALLESVSAFHKTEAFSDIFMVSAKNGDGVEELKQYLGAAMPESPFMYPPDQLADIGEMVVASEVTREKLFMALDKELPYAMTVETEQFERKKNGDLTINQVVFVQKEGQKKIVLGKQGERIKKVGMQARKELERMWGVRIHLFLFVKVREKWKENPDTYRYLGLEIPKS